MDWTQQRRPAHSCLSLSLHQNHARPSTLVSRPNSNCLPLPPVNCLAGVLLDQSLHHGNCCDSISRDGPGPEAFKQCWRRCRQTQGTLRIARVWCLSTSEGQMRRTTALSVLHGSRPELQLQHQLRIRWLEYRRGSSKAETRAWKSQFVIVQVRQTDFILPCRIMEAESSRISSNQESVVELLASLQDQLDSLASQVHTANRDRSNSPPPIFSASASAGAARLQEFATMLDNEATAHDVANTTHRPLRAAGSPGFYGPTSPDYTLNVGQLKLRRNSCPGPPLQEQQLQLASIDEDAASDTIDDEADQDERPSVSPRTVGRQDATPLLTFRSIMGLQEAIQLVHIYQEVVGDLHPVVDMDALIRQAQTWYADSDSGATSCELLMIFNLVLVIALRADSKPSHRQKEKILNDSFQDAVNAKLAAPVYSIKHATIIFLKVRYRTSLLAPADSSAIGLV